MLFLYHFRFLFVWRVRRTLFPSGWCFFYLVTTSSIFDISLCENSINQSAATCSMTPDVYGLTNYRECIRPLDLAKGGTTSIAGYGDLTADFHSNNEWVHVKLPDVAHTLRPHLASIFGTQRPHVCRRQKWVSSQAERGKTVHVPLIGKLCRQYGYRPEAKSRVVDTTCALIAPGQAKTPTTPTDINTFHCT